MNSFTPLLTSSGEYSNSPATFLASSASPILEAVQIGKESGNAEPFGQVDSDELADPEGASRRGMLGGGRACNKRRMRTRATEKAWRTVTRDGRESFEDSL